MNVDYLILGTIQFYLGVEGENLV